MVSQTTECTDVISTKHRPARGGDGGRATAGTCPITSCMAYLRQHYTSQGLSGEATDLLLLSWRQKSSKSYDSLCKKWIHWCIEWQSDPVLGPIEDLVNFLHTFIMKDTSIVHWMCIGQLLRLCTLLLMEDLFIRQHPMVSRLLKEVFQSLPPLPRYTGTWDVTGP